MKIYFTLYELYNRETIDDEFLQAYETLYPAARKKVYERNRYLRRYLEKAKEDYPEADFTGDSIMIHKLILHMLSEDITERNICSEGHRLVNKNLKMRINHVTKGIILPVCTVCKRIYVNQDEDISNIQYLRMEYEIVQGE